MLIFPSMEIFNGKVVSIYRGDVEGMKIYAPNPTEILHDFSLHNVTHLHLIDMNSMISGKMDVSVLKGIKANTSLFVEVGGSVRNMASVQKYLDAGADRVVIGSAAVKSPEFAREALKEFGDRIVISIDMKDGKVALQGQVVKNAPDAVEFALRMQEYGAKTLVCTDVSRAGDLNGLDLKLYDGLNEQLDADIIASGGVGSLEDILELQSMNMYGVIVGKAYYSGAISIREAIRIAV